MTETNEHISHEEVEGLFKTNPERLGKAVRVRAKKKKRKADQDKKYEVQVIPATIGVTPKGEEVPIRRCAAYCRVSTDAEAQTSSYELQCKHYTEYIESREDLTLVKVYADEGLSGTQMKHRDQFLQMIQDCEDGKIDLILTKSLSRFSRNVVDCLTIIRKLKALSPPVEVYFEKENLSSLDDKTDMVLAMMASIAQEESRSISANISWAIRKRMENGTQKIPTACLLGYASDEDGNMVIVEDEAKVVRFIYKNFILGMHPSVIAQKLNKQGSTTVLGNPWSALSVRNILENEKYCGDVLMQKTFTDSYLTHKVKKNNGERQQFFIADHHDAIVSHEVWNRAKELLDKMYYKNWKRQVQQRLIPLAAGILMGYISIDPKWKEVSIARLENATNKVMAGAGGQVMELVQESKEEEREEMEMPDILEGFEVVDIEVGKSDSVLTIMGNMLKFNKPTATELGYPAFVRTLINVPEKKVAIQVCTEKTKNAAPFSKPEAKQSYAITIKNPAIVVAVHKLLPDLSPDDSLTFKGTLYAEEKVIIYDLKKGEPIKRRKRRKPTADSAAGDATTTDAEEVKDQAAGDSADQN